MTFTHTHTIPTDQGVLLTVWVEYDLTYHYDGGGWTSYGGDPPSSELDINSALVEDYSIDPVVPGLEGDTGWAQKLYDEWADLHSEELEAELYDIAADIDGYDDGP